MARDITTGFEAEIEASALKPCILVKAEFDSGDLRLWSGLTEITYNAEAYTGAGNLLSVSAVQETQDLKANNVNFGLSGIPSSLVSIALSEDYQGRRITAWFGVLNDSGLISDPYKIFSGFMDVMSLSDGGETAEITLSAENELIELRDAKERRYTPEDQKIDYPNDKGFEFVPTIQDRIVTWGAGRTD